jgi:hypothetical protein
MPHKDNAKVTVIVSRRVRPGMERAFEEWVAGIAPAAAQFEGYRGTELFRPSADQAEYTLVFSFNNRENLKRWEDSPVRAEWLATVAEMIEGETVVQRVSGLEHWFPVPKDPRASPPPRYKMVIVTVFALYPLINLVVPLLQWLLEDTHPLIRTLVSVTIMVLLMTYLVMPVMIRLLSKWLYGTS